MVETLGFQPRTPRLQGGCSRGLSYAPVALSSGCTTPRRVGHRGALPRPPVEAPSPRWPGWGCRGRAASEPAERRSGASRKRRAQKRSIIEAPRVTVRRAGRRFPVATRGRSAGAAGTTAIPCPEPKRTRLLSGLSWGLKWSSVLPVSTEETLQADQAVFIQEPPTKGERHRESPFTRPKTAGVVAACLSDRAASRSPVT